jgi:hypothetical protein
MRVTEGRKGGGAKQCSVELAKEEAGRRKKISSRKNIGSKVSWEWRLKNSKNRNVNL